MELSLSTRSAGGYTVLEVAGEIDVYTAPQLRERLVELGRNGPNRIIVDLEGVEFLDSTGLGVLVGALKRADAQGGALRLVCTQERILKIFRITGLEQVFGITSSVPEAISTGIAGPGDSGTDG